MTTVPLPLVALFLATNVLALGLLFRATRGSRTVLFGSIAWIAIQSAIALTGFYRDVDSFPPRVLLFAGVPPLVLVVGIVLVPAGRRFVDAMDLSGAILFHTVRIFVEMVLSLLVLHRQVAPVMTPEGGNLDLLVGLTAPLVWWAHRTDRLGTRPLLVWNALALLSLLNAVGRALLSAPFRTQRLSFDRPTVAILDFPFVLLLTFIVPAALFCGLAIFRLASAHPSKAQA